MILGRPWREFLFFVVLSGCLVQDALACREVSPGAEAAHPEADRRTFLIDLHLDKSGSVRSVQVWTGDGPLRSRAVKAAIRWKYRARSGFNPHRIMVVVKFPQGRRPVPNIREAMPAGVSSCVPGGAPVVWPLIPWVNKLLSSQPILPFLAPPSESNKQPVNAQSPR